ADSAGQTRKCHHCGNSTVVPGAPQPTLPRGWFGWLFGSSRPAVAEDGKRPTTSGAEARADVPGPAVETTTDEPRDQAGADSAATGPYTPSSVAALGTSGPSQPGAVVPSIPGYVLEGELGRGGMGVVFRARQTELNRPVAIKMILGGRYTDPMAQA